MKKAILSYCVVFCAFGLTLEIRSSMAAPTSEQSALSLQKIYRRKNLQKINLDINNVDLSISTQGLENLVEASRKSPLTNLLLSKDIGLQLKLTEFTREFEKIEHYSGGLGHDPHHWTATVITKRGQLARDLLEAIHPQNPLVLEQIVDVLIHGDEHKIREDALYLLGNLKPWHYRIQDMLAEYLLEGREQFHAGELLTDVAAPFSEGSTKPLLNQHELVIALENAYWNPKVESILQRLLSERPELKSEIERLFETWKEKRGEIATPLFNELAAEFIKPAPTSRVQKLPEDEILSELLSTLNSHDVVAGVKPANRYYEDVEKKVQAIKKIQEEGFDSDEIELALIEAINYPIDTENLGHGYSSMRIPNESQTAAVELLNQRKITTTAGAQRYLKLVNHPNHNVRTLAVEMASQLFVSPPRELVDAIVKRMGNDSYTYVNTGCIGTLGFWRVRSDVLLNAFRTAYSESPPEYLKKSDNRVALVFALGFINATSETEQGHYNLELTRALQDPHVEVRQMAAHQLLDRFSPESPKRLLLNQLFDVSGTVPLNLDDLKKVRDILSEELN